MEIDCKEQSDLYQNINSIPVNEREIKDLEYKIDLNTNNNLSCFTLETNNKQNYFKGCKWAPDGSCLMTNSNDGCIRLFNLPSIFYNYPIDFNQKIELDCILKINEGILIYDYIFNPNLKSSDPKTCFLLSSSNGNPIHLWDAYNGKLLNTYIYQNHIEEFVSAYSLLIHPIYNKIYGGYKNHIRTFDINFPRKESTILETHYNKIGQTGIISCLCINEANTNIIAAGSYCKQLALYSENENKQICVLLGHNGGITHIQFSYDGTKLYSGSRKENEIFCWDMRNLSNVLYTLKRHLNSNQKIYFDMDYFSNYLISGDQNGYLNLWNLKNLPDNDYNLKPFLKFKAHNDSINGVSFHPFYPLITTCSGERKFREFNEDETSEEIYKPKSNFENSLKLWFITDKNNYNQII